jgi:PST family polysaccharide transporter
MVDSRNKRVPEKSQFKAFWDFVFLSGGETIGKLAGFLAFAYLARTLSSESYGSVELAVALLSIFGLFVNFGFGPIGAREVSRDHDVAAYWAALIPGTRLLVAIVCIPTMCLVAYLMKLPEEHTRLIWLMSFALIAMIWNQSWLLQGLERMAPISFNQAARMIVFTIGVFVFVNGDDDLLVVGFVELTAATTMALFFLVLQRRLGLPLRVSLRIGEIIQLVKRASSIGLSQSVWAFNQYISIIMVAYLIGGAAVAWFAAAHRIVNALTAYSLVYHFNLFPAASARLTHSTEAYQDLVQASAKVTSWAGVGVAMTGTLFAEPLCVLIYGREFSEASLTFAVLIWSVPLTLMSGHGRWALIATENQRYVLAAQSIGAITTVTSGFLLVPILGPVGASISMLLSHSAVWIVAHYFVSKEVCQIPALKVMILPVLLAVLAVAIGYSLSQYSTFGIVAGLLIFGVGALLLDRELIRDIKRLARIKNEIKVQHLEEPAID